jgi:hypothetical protein
MSTVVVPLAVGAVVAILLVLAVLVIGGLAYMLLIRDNPRQQKVDAEREHVLEEFGTKEPLDFEGDLKAPRDEAP